MSNISGYLQHLRNRNIERVSVCHYCKSQSTGINSDGYAIIFVCDEHLRREPDVILDTSIPGVIHRTYPEGLPVNPAMMDPNIGGYHGKTIDPTPDFKLEHLAPKPEADIWATQIFFEE